MGMKLTTCHSLDITCDVAAVTAMDRHSVVSPDYCDWWNGRRLTVKFHRLTFTDHLVTRRRYHHRTHCITHPVSTMLILYYLLYKQPK